MWRIAFIVVGGSGLIILAVLVAIIGFANITWQGCIVGVISFMIGALIYKATQRNNQKKMAKQLEELEKSYAPKKIYVASSWRNEHYEEVVVKLREAGFNVYDFRNPPSGDPGFKWEKVDPDYTKWTTHRYREMLKHPLAERQFENDIRAMESCDACVIVLPCGRSAHTEAGWFAGRGKRIVAYIPERQEPELMYKLFDKVCCSIDEVIVALNG